MLHHNVECERIPPDIPETYICAWKDRNQLAIGLLREGKGTTIIFNDGIKDTKGITSRDFALIKVGNNE